MSVLATLPDVKSSVVATYVEPPASEFKDVSSRVCGYPVPVPQVGVEQMMQDVGELDLQSRLKFQDLALDNE